MRCTLLPNAHRLPVASVGSTLHPPQISIPSFHLVSRSCASLVDPRPSTFQTQLPSFLHAMRLTHCHLTSWLVWYFYMSIFHKHFGSSLFKFTSLLCLNWLVLVQTGTNINVLNHQHRINYDSLWWCASINISNEHWWAAEEFSDTQSKVNRTALRLLDIHDVTAVLPKRVGCAHEMLHLRFFCHVALTISFIIWGHTFIWYFYVY